ncbi:hypothetical protein Hanom_Chr00s000681g01654921 [Helianthus anomalus]
MASLFPGCDYEHWLIVMDKPDVLFILPDLYVDAENKDYEAELYVNGEIVQRSPELQRGWWGLSCRRLLPLPLWW